MARTRKNAPEAVKAAPAVDFFALAAGVTEDKLVTAGSTKWKDNPFVAILRESYIQDNAGENGVKSTPEVMASQVKRYVLPALRNAAEQLANEDIGIRIKFIYADNDGVVQETGNLAQFVKDTGEDERPVRVKFLGRPKKIYLSDEQKEEAIAHGFVQKDKEGKAFEPTRIDTAAYLQWASEADDEDDDSVDEDVA
jgi:hypothetical protein